MVSSASDRMNEQEEAGSRCSSVEGIKAEGEAIFCGFKMVVLLSSVFFWVLPLYAGGAAALLGRSLVCFFLSVWVFLHPAAALSQHDASTRALLVIVSVSVGPWPLLKGHVQWVRVRPGE